MPKSTRWSACTAQRNDGSFCDRASLPDAPFPICLEHAAQLYGFLQLTIHDTVEDVDPPPAAVEAMLRARGAAGATVLPADSSVVYYLRVDSRIKIGVTTFLEQRIQSYPPGSVLLAAESGDRDIERERHRQFNAYLVGGREWFSPGDRLVQHINQIRAESGMPEFDC